MIIYSVRPGDTLYRLSELFGVPTDIIAADNGLQNRDRLVIGQSLVIPANEVFYTVTEGSTLYSIAGEYGIPLETLLEFNPDLNPISLQIGDKVTIPLAEPEVRRSAVMNGYAYPTISEEALSCALPHLTFISPFSYSLNEQGELIAPDDAALIETALKNGVQPLMTLTNEVDGIFSTEVLSAILADEAYSDGLIDSILTELETKGYYGLNLDMEYIAPADREKYNAFLENLSVRLHENDYILLTAVAPKYSADQPGLLYEAHDYAAQGQFADYVIVMTYEWGYTYSPPMSVQPIEEVRKVLDYAVTEIPSEKILLGMPNYGYDWTLPYTRGTAASGIGLTAAADLAIKNNSEILYDEATQTPYFYYTDNGIRHVVWFDDAQSISAKLELINEYNLAGASWWTINRCFLPNWLIVENKFEVVKL